MKDESEIREVKVKPRDYQPNEAELEEEIYIPTTPEKLARAALQQVKIVEDKQARTLYPPPSNRLYFGDCLDILREEVASESVDLIYLDPPFNSKRLYNAFIGNAQWVAFDDTWRWSEAIDDFHNIVSKPGPLANTMEGLRMIHGEGPNLAYLSYMANRLVECHRVLKSTGSIYLHCDPTMSHSLKLILDGIFGQKNFINEIVWCYKSGGANPKRFFSKKHDLILWSSKSNKYIFNPQTEKSYNRELKPYRFKGVKEYRDKIGWYTLVGMKDYWNIDMVGRTSKERVGYPTQKPLALLDRIIKASCPPNGIVLDPFCGCGTTIEAAQILGRKWIGIDVCVNACKVIEKRISNHINNFYGEVEFIGLPKTANDAKTLANLDAFKFERWAASLVDGMEANKKQRGDGGIDGYGRLAIDKGKFIDLVSQVKGGHTNPGHIQAFNGARQQVGAELGIFTCFDEKVTQGMRDTAASTGRFMDVPKVQIYTVEDYFIGKTPQMPSHFV